MKNYLIPIVLVVAVLFFCVGLGVGTTIRDKAEVAVNETNALHELSKTLDSNDNSSFYIFYYASSKEWKIDIDLGDDEYKTTFDKYEDFMSFISDKEKYYTRVMEVKK